MKYYVQSTNRWAKREDPKFKTLEDKQRACADRFERVGLTMIAIIQFSIQHSYHARQSSPHQSKALYVESGHLPVCWTEVWRSSKPRVQNYSREPTEKIIQIKQGSSGIRIDQKSYADLKRKPMEFQVIERVGEVAYKLELPEELSRVHNTFHVSNLKKCHADEPLAVPLDGLHLDDKLHFVEEPLEIVGREVKRLKRSRIPLVKVRWNSKRGPEFTWEREDQFKKKYPHLFTKTTPSSSAAS
ncbi:hypothetical protein Tco_0422093 [Tanacetum coccineum]